MRETWNPWMVICAIFRYFGWKTDQFQRDFMWNHWNYLILTWMGIHDIELEWNEFPWNDEKYFGAWIFHECEFTDPSLFTNHTQWLPIHCLIFTISQKVVRISSKFLLENYHFSCMRLYLAILSSKLLRYFGFL